MLRDENATVLPFRDSALRRPIDVVAWMELNSPRATESSEARDNVVALAPFAQAARGRRHVTWFGGSPGGEAA